MVVDHISLNQSKAGRPPFDLNTLQGDIALESYWPVIVTYVKLSGFKNRDHSGQFEFFWKGTGCETKVEKVS